MADNEIQILVKAEVAKAIDNLKKVGDEGKKTGTTFDGIFTKMKGGWALVAGIIGGAVSGALTKVTSKAIEFLDLEDDFFTFFRGIEREANTARENLVNGFGLSTEEATKFLGKVAQVTETIGFSRLESVKYSEELIKMAAAFQDTNFNGLKTSQIVDILTASMQGNYKGLRELGVQLTTNEENQIKNAKAISDTAEAQEIFRILTEKSKDSLALFNREGGTLSERLSRTKGVFEDLQTAAGLVLAENVQKIVDSFGGFGVAANRMAIFKAAAQDVLEVIIAAISLAFVPLEFSIRTIIKWLGTAAKSIGSITEAFRLIKQGKFGDAMDEVTDAMEGIGQAVIDFGKAGFDTAIANFNRVKAAATLTRAEVRTFADDVVDGQNRVAASTRRTTSVILTDEEARKKAAKDQADRYAIEAFLAQTETQTKLVELEKQYRNAVDAANRQGMAVAEIDALYAQRKLELETQVTEAIRQENIKRAQDAIGTVSTIFNAIQGAGSAILDFVRVTAEREREEGKITEDEKKKRMKDAAEAQKALSVTQAIISTAQAVVQALTAGPIAGPILAGVIGALGAAQVAAMIATPIPAFAEGGIVSGPQVIMAGERGPEAVLPADLTKMLMDTASRGGGRGDTFNVTVVANDPVAFNNQLKRRYGREVFA